MNAIVPEVAATFIASVMDLLGDSVQDSYQAVA